MMSAGERVEALGGGQERGAGEAAGPGQVPEVIRDGHPQAQGRRAQLHTLHVCQGGQ